MTRLITRLLYYYFRPIEKRKEKSDLEQLLNSLIEKGWKPFGERGAFVEIYRYPNWEITTLDYWITWTEKPSFFKWNSSIRDLVSKESWLWQFVCDREHRFIDKKNYEWARSDRRLKNPYVDYDGVNTEYEWITNLDYQFRLIESSLKDESELEDFLLSNIVIKDE